MKNFEKANTIDKQIELIRDSYDDTVDDYLGGVLEEDNIPEVFKDSTGYKKFIAAEHNCNSGESDIKDFLNPQPGMKYLDVGS